MSVQLTDVQLSGVHNSIVEYYSMQMSGWNILYIYEEYAKVIHGKQVTDFIKYWSNI